MLIEIVITRDKTAIDKHSLTVVWDNRFELIYIYIHVCQWQKWGTNVIKSFRRATVIINQMLLLRGIKQTCFDRIRSKIDYHMSGGKPALS